MQNIFHHIIIMKVSKNECNQKFQLYLTSMAGDQLCHFEGKSDTASVRTSMSLQPLLSKLHSFSHQLQQYKKLSFSYLQKDRILFHITCLKVMLCQRNPFSVNWKSSSFLNMPTSNVKYWSQSIFISWPDFFFKCLHGSFSRDAGYVA